MTTQVVLHRFHRVRLTVFVILAISYMLAFFHRVAPSVMSAELMRDFSTSAAALGSLAAMYFYVYTAMQIPSGVLADTLGVRLSATLGILVAGLGSILFAMAPDFSTASVGRFFVGLGVSVVFVGMMRANTVWWSERRYGMISGFTMVLGNVGAILASGPLAAVLAYASWRSVFVAIGVFSIFMAVVTFAFVRNRPQDAGFPSLREMEGSPPHLPSTRHWFHDLKEVFRNRAVWAGFWSNIGLNGSFLAFIGLWGVPLLRDVHGLSRAEASTYAMVTLAVYAVSALGVGFLSDHIGRRKPVIVVTAFMLALTWLALATLDWKPGWSAYLLYGLLGVTSAGFIVQFGAAKEVVPPAMAGMAISTVNTGGLLGAAITQPLFGWVMDRTWDGTIIDGVRRYSVVDYNNGLWLCFVLTLLSALASLRLRETYCRNITLKHH